MTLYLNDNLRTAPNMSAYKRCSVRLYLQLFIGGLVCFIYVKIPKG